MVVLFMYPVILMFQRFRSSMHMTQKQFALQFGLSQRTLQDWEQGRRTPTGVSRVLLQVLSKEPEAVIRALQT